MKLEINMIVNEAKKAADFYSKLFGAEILSVTDLDQGMNETMMVVAGVEFRVLDENPDFGMVAPTENSPVPMGVNLFVDDINKQAETAKELGCTILMPVTEYPDSNAINFVFRDVFSHTWVINQKMD